MCVYIYIYSCNPYAEITFFLCFHKEMESEIGKLPGSMAVIFSGFSSFGVTDFSDSFWPWFTQFLNMLLLIIGNFQRLICISYYQFQILQSHKLTDSPWILVQSAGEKNKIIERKYGFPGSPLLDLACLKLSLILNVMVLESRNFSVWDTPKGHKSSIKGICWINKKH